MPVKRTTKTTDARRKPAPQLRWRRHVATAIAHFTMCSGPEFAMGIHP